MFESQRSLINEINKIGENNIFCDKNNYYIKQLNSVQNILSAIYNETKKLIELFQNYINDPQKYKLEKDIEVNIKYFQITNPDNIYKEFIFFKEKNEFKKFYELTSNLYLNKYIINISQILKI